METCKQLMAFPLYLSALFFLWVLGKQVGVMGMSVVLGACIVLAFAAWLYQRRYTFGPIMRTFNYAVGSAAFVFATSVLQTSFLEVVPMADVASVYADGNSTRNYEVFSTQRLN